MSRQFNLPTASTNDAKAFPYITTDFTVITFQHYSILFSRRNTKESEILQQTGKIAGTSVRGNLHPVDIFLRQIPFPRGRSLIAFFSHPASGSFSYFLSFTPFFFFIPSFCERRVREDVFFLFFFFSFYESCFCCSIPGCRCNIRGYCNIFPCCGNSIRLLIRCFPFRQQTIIRTDMVTTATFYLLWAIWQLS